NQILLRGFDAFFDRQRNFARFTGAESDVARFIADDDQRGERKVLTALDHLRHAVDRNDLVFQVQTLWSDSLLRLSHYSSFDFASFGALRFSFFGFASASGAAVSGAASASIAAASDSVASSLFKPAARAASVKARTRP